MRLHPPRRYESIIATLCENLESLDEPEAKASMIWIIGEYAERIENADELLESFLESFPEETALVQLQLVTATVKLFLKKPTERPQQMIQLVLTYATQVGGRVALLSAACESNLSDVFCTSFAVRLTAGYRHRMPLAVLSLYQLKSSACCLGISIVWVS